MSRPWQAIGIQPTQPQHGDGPSADRKIVDTVESFAVQLLDRQREYRLAWDADRLSWVVYIR